jgi:hypothetical protein
MLTSIKRIIITLLTLTIIAFVGAWLYSMGRTYYNDEGEIGNTAGNIYNGGLFCEQDGKIYFSNDADDGSLYVMKSDTTNIKKLSDDKAVFINADENYLYYVRANNTRKNSSDGFLMFYNTGVYRINHNGSGLKAFTGNPGSYLMLSGNYIYFQRYETEKGLFMYRYKIDTSEERLLINDAVIPTAVMNNSLYYAGYSNDHNINKYDLSSFTNNTAYDGNYGYPIFTGQYIYYMDISDNYKLYRMKADGSDKTLLVNKRCSTYNITNSGKYLYYQVDDTKKNSICRLNLETMEAETLLKGNFKQINVTDNYVFFKDFDNTNTFIQSADGIIDINTFNPPNLSDAEK